ncbi:MAG: hypothetical protein J5564_02755, partial [Clostridia bacterium]|nr:hypothetical protein [Clostridia bacterium]
KLIKGFTMVYDSGDMTDLYLEADFFGFPVLMRLAVDSTYENEDPRAWTAEIVLNDEERSQAVFAARLKSVVSGETPQVRVSPEAVVSAVDALRVLKEKLNIH